MEGDWEDDQLPRGPRRLGFSQVRDAERGVRAALSRGPLLGFLGLDELSRDVERCHHLYWAAVWGLFSLCRVCLQVDFAVWSTKRILALENVIHCAVGFLDLAREERVAMSVALRKRARQI